MTNLTMMLKSGYCPPPENMDKKTAQFFICMAYMRYRNARKHYYWIKDKDPNGQLRYEYWGIMTENWNNLQLYKTYYYGVK